MKKPWRANTIRAVLGIAVGLGIAEIAFRVRDKGAFPHLNVYLADPVLGARLRPGATEKIRFGSRANPVTSVRVNRDGYRGEDWPPPNRDEVVVVGDSQVFGLGVEEGETFSAELARQLDVPVRNLGVCVGKTSAIQFRPRLRCCGEAPPSRQGRRVHRGREGCSLQQDGSGPWQNVPRNADMMKQNGASS